ncbi:MAG TPA: hypothetical protein PL033_03765 [Candidatus Brocadiia bacterium]|nr:hypothetical protein [Candidatus Brocadiia bacterium]
MNDRLQATPPAGSEEKPSRGCGAPTLHAALLAIVVFAFFARTIGFEFVNREFAFLRSNPILKDVHRIFEYAQDGVPAPVLGLAQAGQYRLFEMVPNGYHAINVLFHALNAGLIYVICRKIGFKSLPSAAGVLLWALHPLRVESVAWVMGLPDILGLFFCLVCGLLYFRLREHLRTFCGASIEPAFSMPSYWFCAVAFLFAAGACPTICAWPLLLVLVDAFLDTFPLDVRHDEVAPTAFIERLRIVMQVVIRKLMLAAPMLLIIAFAVIDLVMPSLDVYWTEHKDFPVNPLVTCFSLCFHAGKIVFPANLCAEYVLPEPVSLRTGAYSLAVAGCLAFVGLAIFTFKRAPWVCCALLCFPLGILPRVIQTIPDSRSLADSYTYLPGIAVSILIGQALVTLGAYLKEKAVILKRPELIYAIVIGVYGIAAWQQMPVWRDSLTFWADAAQRNPNSPQALGNHGLALLMVGSREEGVEQLQKARDLAPGCREYALNLALGLSDLISDRKAFETLQAFSTVSAPDKDERERMMDVAELCLQVGMNRRAAIIYDELSGKVADDPVFHALTTINAAEAYRRAGKFEISLKLLGKVPEVVSLNVRGRVYLDLGRLDEAEADFGKWDDTDANKLLYHDNTELAVALSRLASARGDIVKGINICRDVLTKSKYQADPILKAAMAALLLESAQSCQIRHTRFEQLEEAENTIRQALESDPDNWEWNLIFARVLFERARTKKAYYVLWNQRGNLLAQPELSYHFARICSAMGKTKLERTYLLHALAHAPRGAYWLEAAAKRYAK